MKILVCDDDPIIRYLLAIVLERRAGHEVTALGDPERVLEVARTTTPDLIVLDQMMPGLEGTEVAARLNSDPATCSIPVVLLTGRDGIADEIDLRAVGIIDVVVKPFDTERLAGRLEAATALPIGP